MTDRYKRIREALAMGPTPGPWAACRTNSGTFVKSEGLAGYFVEVRHCRTAQDVNADAHLIAACDPDTIRALLAERDALVAEVERLTEALRKLEERVQRDEALLRQALEALEVSTRFVYADMRPQCESTIDALRERLAETTDDLTRCPNCGGPADNGHDREVPPNPYWCSKCTES